MRITQIFSILAASSLGLAAPLSSQRSTEPETTDLWSICKDNNGHEPTYDRACMEKLATPVMNFCKYQFSQQANGTIESYKKCLDDSSRQLWGVDRFSNGQFDVWISREIK